MEPATANRASLSILVHKYQCEKRGRKNNNDQELYLVTVAQGTTSVSLTLSYLLIDSVQFTVSVRVRILSTSEDMGWHIRSEELKNMNS